MRACSSWALSWRTRSAAPAPCALDRLDLARGARGSVSLSPSCSDCSSVGGLEQRRALLGRVADAGTLRGELGGDQEAEREQRRAERDLPARDAAQASDRRSRDAVGGRLRRRPRPGRRRRRRAATSDDPAGTPTAGDRTRAPIRAVARARPAPATAPRAPPPADPAHAAGSGPDGAGCGPSAVGSRAVDVGQPGRPEGGRRPRRAPP